MNLVLHGGYTPDKVDQLDAQRLYTAAEVHGPDGGELDSRGIGSRRPLGRPGDAELYRRIQRRSGGTWETLAGDVRATAFSREVAETNLTLKTCLVRVTGS